jgi:outer membrane biogenesis lipoprotein LolB
MSRRRALGLGLWALGLALSACGPRRFTLPTDPGTPFPDFAQIHSQLSSSCRGVRTLTVVLGLSGRAGDESLRGRVIAGFERPDSMRLEGVAPFGAPAFVLAARGEMATLVLPRDNRVVQGAEPEEILGALTGVTLAPADLQALLTGCVVPVPRPIGGRGHGHGMASIDLAGGAMLYLQRQGGSWRVRAARRDGWQVEYPAWPGAFPGSMRLRSDAQALDVDLTATISELEANVDLDASVFTVDVPAGAEPLTLEELRAAEPLREEPQ